MNLNLLSFVIIFTYITTALAAETHYETDNIRIKTELMESAAKRAIAQQRKTHLPDFPLVGAWSGAGKVQVEESTDWDIDGDGRCYKITVSDINNKQRDKGIKGVLQVRFPEAVDFRNKGTGLSFWIKCEDDLSPDLRFGTYFKGSEPDPIVFTDIPVKQKFGDNPHRVYIDWGFVFDHTCGVMKTPKTKFWETVTGFDLPFAHRRLPNDGKKLEPVTATFYIDGLALSDIWHGSYDSVRFKNGGVNTVEKNLTAQGRYQQVARICAKFGGAEGQQSAIDAMDMLVRLQCWDGSWPELRTRLQGEFTHGMIVADMAYALESLREAKHPALQEKIKIRHFDDTRERIYEKFIYRGAMSRAPGPIKNWKDSYCSGGALKTGANRPMVLIFSQWVTAQQMTGPKMKQALLEDYDKNMDDLVAHQGITAGGWPIFGEGSAFKGKGLNFDLGYTKDHVYIMAYASRVTNDKRWGDMIRKFDEVVKTMILKDGIHFEGPWHERKGQKRGGKGLMKVSDIVYQEALRQNAPYFTQWGYNTHVHDWKNFPRDLWKYTGTARGYGLGAFLTWNIYDMQTEPIPKNPGLYFPRQWPIHSVSWHHKDGRKNVRKSLATVGANGEIAVDFTWELGEYPVTNGLPLALKSSTDITVEVVSYTGKVSSLAADAALTVTQDGNDIASSGEAFSFKADKATTISVKTADVSMSFIATPVKDAANIEATLIRKP